MGVPVDTRGTATGARKATSVYIYKSVTTYLYIYKFRVIQKKRPTIYEKPLASTGLVRNDKLHMEHE